MKRAFENKVFSSSKANFVFYCLSVFLESLLLNMLLLQQKCIFPQDVLQKGFIVCNNV